MRTAALLILTAPILAAQDQPTGAISGRVMDGLTGEPARRVQLMLFPTSPKGRAWPLITTSDPLGNFYFATAPAGTWTLSTAPRGRYPRQTHGQAAPMSRGTVLVVEAGRETAGIEFVLQPGAVVSGRVLDEDGEPMAMVRVMLMQARLAGRDRYLFPAVQDATTDDLGEYRIYGVPQGEFIAVATFAPDRFGEAPPEYPLVYHPSSHNAAGATPLDLKPGATMTGVDFRFGRVHLTRIGGSVESRNGAAPRGLLLTLVPSESTRSPLVERRTATASPRTGRFEFRHVPPGSYLLQGFAQEGRSRLYLYEPLELGNTDMDDLRLVLAPGTDVRGEIRVEGQPPQGFAFESLNLDVVSLEPGMQFTPVAENTEIFPDGAFIIRGLQPGLCTIRVRPLPAGLYLRSVARDREDVLRAGLRAGGASSPVVITLGTRPAGVQGVAVDEQGNPAPGATVVLTPEEPERRQIPEDFRFTAADANGRFRSPASPPAPTWSSPGARQNSAPGRTRLFLTATNAVRHASP